MAIPHPRMPRMTIGRRFGVVLLIVVPLVATVGLIGAIGVNRTNRQVELTYQFHRQTLAAVELRGSLTALELSSQRLIRTENHHEQEALSAALDRRILPRVERAFLRNRLNEAEHEEIGEIAARFRRYERLRETGAFEHTGTGGDHVKHDDAVAERLSNLFAGMAQRADHVVAKEAREVQEAYESSRASHRSTLVLLLLGSLVVLLASVSVVVWLTRSIVPRARRYSGFAATVADGRTGERLEPAGHDELSELGELLNRMVAQREGEQRQVADQAEFSDAMQLAESETEAYELLKRHLERTLGNARVTVLNRNNSEDRLEAKTPLAGDDPLSERLGHAKPRNCLAVRSGERQDFEQGRKPLLECEICGALGPSTCQPLLVGGEVLGSVLAMHEGSLGEEQREAVRISVAQAAPTLANLRNLAIAEERAGTDALTGLANQRAGHDAVKRIVAEATRTGEPLGAIVLDLDHFKQINDIHGHAAGDDVLAVVGMALRATLRPDDFCARWGGEEFLVLLPRTDVNGARAAAENLRLALADIKVGSVQRKLSASLGVAVMPTHAVDADGLVRSADRALCAAKNAGRNRVEIVQEAYGNGSGPSAELLAEGPPSS